jgi:hypothetical protein
MHIHSDLSAGSHVRRRQGPLIRAFAVLALLLSAAGCSSRHELNATVRDDSGNPIPGAVFYAEAYTNSGAFDFAFAQAGKTGEVPAAGRGPLTIRWRWGAKLALAALAPGKKPIVLLDPLGRIKADGIVISLPGRTGSTPAWEPSLALLSFPFEADPALAARMAAPEFGPLRRAFREAYAMLGSYGLPQELAKRAALERLPE